MGLPDSAIEFLPIFSESRHEPLLTDSSADSLGITMLNMVFIILFLSGNPKRLRVSLILVTYESVTHVYIRNRLFFCESLYPFLYL